MAPIYDGFLPGQHQIEGYRAGGFHFAGMSHKGSILALPSGIRIWDAPDFESLTPESFEAVLAEGRGAIDILLIGSGAALRPLPREIRTMLRAAGILADVMATHHAIPTYNLLLGERRKAAAALIASGP